MAESRFIVNEIQRSVQGLSVEGLQNLINSSATLKHLIDVGYRGILTPQNVEKILREVQESQKITVDINNLLKTINNVNNNPF